MLKINFFISFMVILFCVCVYIISKVQYIILYFYFI